MKQFRKGILLLLMMVSAAALAIVLQPTVELAQRDKINLAAMVPATFGDWRIDPAVLPIAPPPDLQAVIDKTYDQTLSRTYVDAEGRHIMLSIAYGGRQDQGMQTHRPEICYPAQGLQIVEPSVDGTLATPFGTLPVRQLVAGARNRVEPITYWLIVGDQPTGFGFAYRLTTLKYGLTGKIPDGMLIRVSSLGADTAKQYQLHQAFIDAMLTSLSPEARQRLMGVPGNH